MSLFDITKQKIMEEQEDVNRIFQIFFLFLKMLDFLTPSLCAGTLLY